VLGVLVTCDASIKSIIVKIDSEEHAFIVEELDDSTLVVKENMLSILKMRLDEVGASATDCYGKPNIQSRFSKRLNNLQRIQARNRSKSVREQIPTEVRFGQSSFELNP
jgi:TFIIH basal transcription factor complex TTD-A subunit